MYQCSQVMYLYQICTMLDNTLLNDLIHRLYKSSCWLHTQALCIEVGAFSIASVWWAFDVVWIMDHDGPDVELSDMARWLWEKNCVQYSETFDLTVLCFALLTPMMQQVAYANWPKLDKSLTIWEFYMIVGIDGKLALVVEKAKGKFNFDYTMLLDSGSVMVFLWCQKRGTYS